MDAISRLVFLSTLGLFGLCGGVAAQVNASGEWGPSVTLADDYVDPWDLPSLDADSLIPRHYLYVELAGNSGDRMSVNYEYALARFPQMTFTARVGVFYFRENQATPLKIQRDAGDMIFGIGTIYQAGTRHRIETGLGVNVRWQRLEGVTDFLSSNLFSAQIGYRMLPRDGSGFLFRGTLMLIHNAEYNWLEYYVEGEQRRSPLMPWAGVSVGYAF